MCGIISVTGVSEANKYIYDALGLLQHRGQDSAGIATLYDGKFYLNKNEGLLNSVFGVKELTSLLGTTGIGHVRYPTAGNSGVSESQPFYVNSPYGIMFAHNGNLTNVKELRKHLSIWERRHLNTESDSELLLNLFAYGLQNASEASKPSVDATFKAVEFVNQYAKGGYACVSIIVGLGTVAFRDPNGIRPFILGRKKINNTNKYEYMLASESVALDITGFDFVRDIEPGEAIIIDENGEVHTKICAKETKLAPCLFEYVYFSRPDSILNGVSVYKSRIDMGKKLGDRILERWGSDNIDVVIPIPETGRIAAQEIANKLNVLYREGFVKNRYVGRTFIMPNATSRKNSVRRKLNPIAEEFKGKNVLLVDDSIVRGTTSREIINMVRELGAKSVYFASAAPAVKYPNVYGIDIPNRQELLANNRTLEEITKWIGVDGLIYLPLEDLKECLQESNPSITHFEDSVFTGNYITGDIDDSYLSELEESSEKSKNMRTDHLAYIANNLIPNS